jgi:hypothetical protein
MALSEGLNSNGISTSVVTGETTRAERQKIYDELSRGKIKLISSVGVLTEGFDIKSISCVVMARPTKSWALNCQMAGRGLRIHPDKTDCIILDLAGNHARHGLASKITREEMAPDYPDPKKGTAPTRECPECSFVCRACDRECPECGHQFPIHEKKKPELKGDLVEIDCGVLMSTNPKMKKAYGDFVRDAMRKNHSPHMPRFRFKENFGRYPNKGEMFQAAFSGHPQYMGAYLAYLKTQARLKNKDEKWVQSFLKMEFGTLKVKETA